MNISTISPVRRGLIATAAAVTLVFGSAGPAAAGEITGEGAGTGYDQADAEFPVPCGVNLLAAHVRSYVLNINHTGGYQGLDDQTGSPVSYVGPSDVTVTALQDFYFSPLGTHDPNVDPTCTLPQPVTVEVQVSGTGTDPVSGRNGSVTCSGTGTYTRANSTVVVEFAGDCTVVGNVLPGSATDKTQHVLEGNLTPCVDLEVGVCPPEAGSIYEGAYEAEPVILP